MFHSIVLLQSDDEKLGVTDFVSEIKRVENYPDFEKLAHTMQHGVRGFIVKNREFKHDVYGRRQTAKSTSEFLFSSRNP